MYINESDLNNFMKAYMTSGGFLEIGQVSKTGMIEIISERAFLYQQIF